MWLNSVSLGRFQVAGWGGCSGCDNGWSSLMKVQAVDVCENDGGGGDSECEADGREATGSTGRGGRDAGTKQRFRPRSLIITF